MSENTLDKRRKVTSWITAIFGFLGAILYSSFTVISISHYPGEFKPLEDYLSILGNSDLNPNGAIFYNIAIFCAAFTVFSFFVGFGMCKFDLGKKKLVTSITIFGVLNAIAIALSGIYTESKNMDVHFFASLFIFITLIPLFILASIYLVRNGLFSKILAISGFVLAAFNIFFVVYVLTIGTSTGSIIEWLSIFTYIGWAVFNGINLLINKKSFIRLNTPTNS
ncbi:MAG: DUF998 domain-containing protein [Asgard group archaeon]|nr:DUF998 domain-containing protein [Asgard group archaeon]